VSTALTSHVTNIVIGMLNMDCTYTVIKCSDTRIAKPQIALVIKIAVYCNISRLRKQSRALYHETSLPVLNNCEIAEPL
jgi:hypothetical protein